MFSLNKGVNPDVEVLEESFGDLKDNIEEFTSKFKTNFSDTDFETLLAKIENLKSSNPNVAQFLEKV